MAAMRAALVRHVDMNTNLQSGMKEAEEKIAGCDRRIKGMAAQEAVAKAELIRLQKENEGLRKENQGARAALIARDSKLVELQGLAAGHLSKLEQSLKLLDAAEGKKKAAESWATTAESRACAAEDQISAVREELSTARGELLATREELSSARDELSTTRGELLSARDDLSKANDAATRAVEAYKESGQFGTDASLACVDMYEFGYNDCLAKVKKVHPGLDLSRATYEAEDEEEEEGEVRDDGAGTAPVADSEENSGVPKGVAPAENLPAADATEAATPGEGRNSEKEGLPVGTIKNSDSGGNASEPIVVESPEPGCGQEPPAEEILS